MIIEQTYYVVFSKQVIICQTLAHLHIEMLYFTDF
jgi:hypothetical protein